MVPNENCQHKREEKGGSHLLNSRGYCIPIIALNLAAATQDVVVKV